MNQKNEIPMSVHKALKRFEKAVRDHAFRGSFDHEHRNQVDENFVRSKANLIVKIKKAIIQNQGDPL
jgi:hypothetical protein